MIGEGCGRKLLSDVGYCLAFCRKEVRKTTKNLGSGTNPFEAQISVGVLFLFFHVV
jgi:hypothetical protein